MISQRQMAEYVGFAETEIKAVCKEHDMSFTEMQRWYDGYYFERIIEAGDGREFGNYWSVTETYESLKVYIAMNDESKRI